MLNKVPESKRRIAEKIVGVGDFCGHAIRTMVHVKRWWLLNKHLEIEYDQAKANAGPIHCMNTRRTAGSYGKSFPTDSNASAKQTIFI